MVLRGEEGVLGWNDSVGAGIATISFDGFGPWSVRKMENGKRPWGDILWISASRGI
jgi:hypothetical protein